MFLPQPLRNKSNEFILKVLTLFIVLQYLTYTQVFTTHHVQLFKCYGRVNNLELWEEKT